VAAPAIDSLRSRISKEDLDYVRALATTLLAILVLPLAILHFLLHPLEVADHAITRRAQVA
jgi:hypothetical protein